MKSFWIPSNDYENRPAVITRGESVVSYKKLFEDVEKRGDILRASQKQLILILAENNYETIISYLATLQNRDAVMLINAELDEQLINGIINTYQPNYIIGNLNHKDYQRNEDGISKRRIESLCEIHQELALLLSTSGTTGSVKFVRLSYRNLHANAKSIAEYLQITASERGMANLPIHYSYGLSVINSHLHAGATLLLTNESVLTKTFWDFLRKEKVTSLAGVPYTYQMLQRIGFHKMDLPHLRCFTQAGGRLSEKLVRLFSEYAVTTNKKFFVMYGQTEATARISYVPPDCLTDKSTSIGRAIPDGKMYLDADTSELIFEGPNVMLGYATNLKDLAKGDELQGVLHTGDIADIDEDGFYYIKGRMKRIIKLFGLRLNLDDIEKKIETTCQTNVTCVGSDDKLVLIIREEGHKEQIQYMVEHLFKLHRSAFRVKVMDDLPRLSNGKVNYEALKDWVL